MDFKKIDKARDQRLMKLHFGVKEGPGVPGGPPLAASPQWPSQGGPQLHEPGRPRLSVSGGPQLPV